MEFFTFERSRDHRSRDQTNHRISGDFGGKSIKCHDIYFFNQKVHLVAMPETTLIVVCVIILVDNKRRSKIDDFRILTRYKETQL